MPIDMDRGRGASAMSNIKWRTTAMEAETPDGDLLVEELSTDIGFRWYAWAFEFSEGTADTIEEAKRAAESALDEMRKEREG
jgi:hypothetical protein